MKNIIRITLAILLITAWSVQASISSSPEGAKVYIVSPADGETVGETVTIVFGLKGMGVAPADIERASTGHHHLLIDSEELPALDQPLGKEVKHFGGGQTQYTVQLSKGKHTLQLIMGNHQHIPHNPAVVSEKITIFVK